jgi:ribose transport system ATP-binding protein
MADRLPAKDKVGAPEGQQIVVLQNVHKRFGSTHAVNNVTIRFASGEVHALLGENGAGKSTLGKIVGGLFPPDEGKLILDGRQIHYRNIAEARSLGVAMVFQELSLVPDLTVRENICLGMETVRHPLSLLAKRKETAFCRSLLAEYQFDFDLEAPVRDLSIANQQLIEVVKALARSPRVLILDEPTAMLGVRENKRLLQIIHSARQRGMAIIFVTHHVEEVIEVADCVSLMKDGVLIDSFPITEGIDTAYIVKKLVGRSAAEVAGRRAALVGEEVVQIAGLPSRDGGRVDITVHRGEVVGLYGVVGSGCERISNAVVGLADIRPTTMTLAGTHYRPTTPAQAARRGVSYLPSGRAANCVLPSRSTRENLMVSQLSRVQMCGVLRDRVERKWTESQLARFRARYADYDDLITSLSGGNQQKVVLGRSLSRKGVLLVLEDPTAGVDIGSKQDIHGLIRQRAADGIGVLLVSSDLLETIAICDVIYTVIGGKIVRKFENPTTHDEARIIADVLGGRVEDGEHMSASSTCQRGNGP